MIQPVILCGGAGTRLWPVSRPERPKPFLPLVGEGTLFEQALGRVADTTRFAAPLVVAGEAHAGLIATQAGRHRLIVEPSARNTAPAIALAAHSVTPDTVLLVCPSDHHIADEEAFLAGVEKAAALVREGWLVCFGVEPDRPETGYGYIERGAAEGAGHRIARFVEKPDEATARGYLASGNFAWNAGIFVFRAGDFLEELACHRAEMAGHVAAAMESGEQQGARLYPDAETFAAIKSESIDYAVMENTGRGAVVSAAMGWSDIGNWDALMAAQDADAQGNVAGAKHDLVDCSGVMVRSDGPRVSVLGLEDVVVVVDGDEVLVTHRTSAQKVATLKGARGE